MDDKIGTSALRVPKRRNGMPDDTINIVSGLPRSGTSMLMKMLDAGGVKPLTDNIREADIDNPKGYYEFERVKKLPEDTEWLDDAKGLAVKVLAELVMKLPPGYKYRIVFIERNMDEMIDSQNKMLVRRGEDPDKVPRDELKGVFTRYLVKLKAWIETQDNIKVLYVSYNDILDKPKKNISRMYKFFDEGLDRQSMLDAIDDRLYRNRA
jgi:hypothetical protein